MRDKWHQQSATGHRRHISKEHLNMYPGVGHRKTSYAASLTRRVKRSLLICFYLCVVLVAEGSLPAQIIHHKWIPPGKGSDTIAMTTHNGIYTIEKSGALYRTDKNSGNRLQSGQPEFANTKFLFGQSGSLYTIETDGSLYRISASDGSWERVGKAGDWKNTIALYPMNLLTLYSIERNGALYKTDLESGRWVQVGKAEFANTRFMFGDGVSLYTIEADGSLYRVNSRNGTWKRLGRAGDWKNTILGVDYENRIYTVEQDGALYETDMRTGAWKQVGKAEFGKAKFMSWFDDAIYIIEDEGFFRVNPGSGLRILISK